MRDLLAAGSRRQFGLVALFGSGETSPTGGRVFESLASRLPSPPNIAVLETPAGFELNSTQVAGRVADFISTRLQNYRPQVSLIPARRRGTPFSPDDPIIARALLRADMIFMGPGSPTYAVRQLKDSLTWQTLIARHRRGAAIVLASAATIAAGAHTLPVYEIYKAGEELHWRTGLNFFGAFGLSLVFIPHWDNNEGGAELDTSRCFMGRARFAELRAMLPPDTTIVGIDEHTVLLVDLASAECKVTGRGGVTVIRGNQENYFASQSVFPITSLGKFHCPEPAEGLPPALWEEISTAQAESAAPPQTNDEVMSLVAERQAARERRDWAAADSLRQRIAALGWKILDTPDGAKLEPL